MKKCHVWAAVLGAVVVVTPVSAKAPVPAGAMVNEEFGVPVFPYDVTDRPYEVLGEVEAGVRKATIFSKAPNQGKIYRELWERAAKLGADAVVKAQYGDAHVTALSWGSVTATGVAVKFTGPATEASTPVEGVETADASTEETADEGIDTVVGEETDDAGE